MGSDTEASAPVTGRSDAITRWGLPEPPYTSGPHELEGRVVRLPPREACPGIGAPPPPATVTITRPPTTATRCGACPMGTRPTAEETGSIRISAPSMPLATQTAPSPYATSDADRPTGMV